MRLKGFFLGSAQGGRGGVAKCAFESKGESCCREMYLYLKGYLKNESLPGLRTPQALGEGCREMQEISPFTPAVSNLKTFYSADLNVGE